MSSASVAKGLIAGLVGGLAAAWVMNQFQSLVGKASEGAGKPHGAQSVQGGPPLHGAAAALQKVGLEDADDNAAERSANIIAAKVFDQRLSEKEKHAGGAVAHYLFGAATGAIYGAASELLPQTTVGAGVPFGAAVWLFADEMVVPALGLSKASHQYGLSTHATALASHIVYGVTTEMFRRVLRKAWRSDG